ncbi:MAG TPA: DinB family protein, partial [Bryobacteraceae bacterium]|nr:DinB family protein [Bryobacteraceae bacterium]
MKNDVLKTEIAGVLRTSGAHADFEKAIKGFPLEDAGKRPKGVPWSAWQLLEHMRFTQADILEYVSGPGYSEKNWPDDYWPESPEPPSEEA